MSALRAALAATTLLAGCAAERLQAVAAAGGLAGTAEGRGRGARLFHAASERCAIAGCEARGLQLRGCLTPADEAQPDEADPEEREGARFRHGLGVGRAVVAGQAVRREETLAGVERVE